MKNIKTIELSPLDQIRRSEFVNVTGDAQKLSLRDQAVLTQIFNGKSDYVPNKLFSRADAQRKIFDEAAHVPTPDTSWYHPVMDSAGEHKQSASVGTVLLTAAQERVLFLQFNYCRYKVAKLKEKMAGRPRSAAQAREIVRWQIKADAYRDQIAQTNLALVLAMAKRARLSEMDFPDLVSEGNMALLRAVDKFDVARGFKFSTYGCRAILKAFSRSGIKMTKYRQLFPTDFDPKYERSDFMNKKRESHEDDCADEVRQIIMNNRAELSDIEQSVIEHRFAIGSRKPKGLPRDTQGRSLTLEEVGRIIGVTKERVRQIQNRALDKIRDSLESDFLA